MSASIYNNKPSSVKAKAAATDQMARTKRRPWSALEHFKALAEGDRTAAFRRDPDPKVTNWFEAQREGWVRSVLKNKEVRPTTKVVATTLAFHINRESLDAWPGERTMAAVTGLSRNTVRQAIRELESWVT